MKILAVSDIHRECSAYDLDTTGADVVVMAGDIGIGLQGLKWASSLDKPVVYVAGNHEFEGLEVHDFIKKARTFCAEHENVYFLQQDEVIIEGVRFIGCTLWTDFELFGLQHKQQAMFTALHAMPEYSSVIFNRKLLHVSDVLRMHESDKKWLKHKLREGYSGESVVVTHHAPHKNSVSHKYSHDYLSAAFASNLEHMMGFNPLWIHGHTHTGFDYTVHGTRVVCNPRGYFNIANEALHTFNKNKIIELESNSYGLKP